MREYAEACRLRRVKRRLREGREVTAAMLDAGYGSSSRFYERAAPKLGMRPATYRRGGGGMQVRYTIVDSPLGRLLIAATGRGVCSIAMASSDRELEHALSVECPAAAIIERLSPKGDRLLARLKVAAASGCDSRSRNVASGDPSSPTCSPDRSSRPDRTC